MLTKIPKTKQKFTRTIHQPDLDQFKILDIPTKYDSGVIKEELENLISSGSKPVVVMFLKAWS